MGIRGRDRQVDHIEFNVSDIPVPDGYELAVWTAQA